MKFFFTWLLVFLTIYSNSVAQNISTEGDDFWIGFMENWLQDPNNPIILEIYISADDTTEAVIEIPGMANAFPPLRITIMPDRSSIIPIPTDLAMMTGTNMIQNKAIHITTQKDVSVFAMNKRQFSADMAVILPTLTLGNNYRVMSHWEDGNRDNNSHSDSEFVIVGVEDNTSIEITPSVFTNGGNPAGLPFTITLNKGQCYQVQASAELTGTQMRAIRNTSDECKRFAVFAGNKYTKVGRCNHPDGHDHLYSQMYPLNTWGTDYITLNFLNRRGGDYIKVLAGYDSTKIYLNGEQKLNMGDQFFHAGEYYVDLLDGVNTITSDKPVSVGQFSRSQACDTTIGDPFQIMINPNQQVLQKITFYAPEIATIANYDLSIIAKTSDIESVILDNNHLVNDFITVPGNNDFSYARILIQGGNHILKSQSGIIAYVYGYGSNESFGYATGAGLGNINLQIKVIDDNLALIPSDSVCHNTPFYFKPVTDIKYNEYIWHFGDGNSMILTDTSSIPYLYEKPGKYIVTLLAKSSSEGCTGAEDQSVQIIKVLNPKVSILGPRSVCPNTDNVLYWVKEHYPYKYTWNSSGGSISSDVRNDSIYIDWGATNPLAMIEVIAENERGCVGDSTIKLVKVKDKLEPDAPVGPDTLCADNLINHSYTAYDVPGTTYSWQLLNGEMKSNDGTNISVIDWNSFGFGYLWFFQQSLIDTVCAGISDTLIVYIQRKPEEILEIISDKDQYTIGDPVHLSVNTDSLFHMVNWDFGDGRNMDSAALSFTPEIMYLCQGNYLIAAVASDTAGICDARAENNLWINVKAPEIEITQITHEDFVNNRLFIHWNEIDPDYQKPVYLYRFNPDNKWKVRDTLNHANTVFRDTLVQSDRFKYFYLLKTNEDCADSILSNAHNNIFLEIQKNNLVEEKVELHWNDYINWPGGVKEYEIWLKIDEQPYTKIGSAGTEQYEYSNQNNGFDHCFVVKANENGGNESYSWSNVGCYTFAPGIYPYNVITPNDDGKNESFIIKNIEFYPNSVLSIYNRWGKKIAIFKGYKNNWTGTENGEILANSAYFYVLELNEPRSGISTINGIINILR